MIYDPFLTTIILGSLILILGISVFVLDRRIRTKGDILSALKYQPRPGGRLRYYLIILAFFIGVALVFLGYYSGSWVVVGLGVILTMGSISVRDILEIWELILEGKKRESVRSRAGGSISPPAPECKGAGLSAGRHDDENRQSDC
jgi:hypothetical protein